MVWLGSTSLAVAEPQTNIETSAFQSHSNFHLIRIEHVFDNYRTPKKLILMLEPHSEHQNSRIVSLQMLDCGRSSTRLDRQFFASFEGAYLDMEVSAREKAISGELAHQSICELDDITVKIRMLIIDPDTNTIRTYRIFRQDGAFRSSFSENYDLVLDRKNGN
jgi:hypothetical protein